MSKRYRLGIVLLLAISLLGLSSWFLGSQDFAVLNPKGTVAAQQRDLLIQATLLMLLVVIPVFILLGAFAWRYRESNHKAKYSPDIEGSRLGEAVWWIFPFIIISIISAIIWRSSHALDPYKPLESNKKSLTIQVIALEWKWLFIYPEQNIASVNYLQFPEDTPINFEITSDAPMNSFWIPQLGGQVYAMSGMQTKLHLMADEPGEYQGSSANLSGKGFAGMKFIVKASSEGEFEQWIQTAMQSSNTLSESSYQSLAEPSENHPKQLYGSAKSGLFHDVIMKYMKPSEDSQPLEHQPGRYDTEAAHSH